MQSCIPLRFMKINYLAPLVWLMLASVAAAYIPVGYPPQLDDAQRNATVGQAFNYQISAKAYPEVTNYSAAGLPAGLAVNSSTGLISGTPAQAGEFTVDLFATNSKGTGSATLGLLVSKGTASISFTGLTAAYTGSPHTVAVTTVPAGLAVDILYDGETALPISAGYHSVAATINDALYEGSATTTLFIGYTVTATATNGTVGIAPQAELYPPTTSIQLTATSNEGYMFKGWEGNVPEGMEMTNPLPFEVSRNYSLIATFFRNTAGPSDISLDVELISAYSESGDSLGEFTVTGDPDADDKILLELVEGEGAIDNGLFRIEGNQLVSNGPIDYATQRYASIRVRAEDIGGLGVEKVFALQVIDPAPSARFSLIDVRTRQPNYVTIVFRLTDTQDTLAFPNGRGINLPVQWFEQNPDFLEIREMVPHGSSPSWSEVFAIPSVSKRESATMVSKIGDVSSRLRTILLLDNSASISTDLPKIREAAALLVDNMIEGQEIAIYTFSNEMDKVLDFSSDPEALKEAINTIELGGFTTDLYGSVADALELWEDSIDQYGTGTYSVDLGSLVVLSDGVDEASTPGVTLDSIVQTLQTSHQMVFTIGFGSEIKADVLTRIGTVGYQEVKTITAPETEDIEAIEAAEQKELEDLLSAFVAAQNTIIDETNSFYWLTYSSPKRGNDDRWAIISIPDNGFQDIYDGAILVAPFNSNGFDDGTRGTRINRTVDNPDGEFSMIVIPNTGTSVLTAQTFHALVDSSFEWTLEDESVAAIVATTESGSRIEIAPGGCFVTTLTVTDVGNEEAAADSTLGVDPDCFTTTVTLVAGSPWLSSLDPWVGWRYSYQFGLFYDETFPWVWHDGLGWIWYAQGDEDKGLILYSQNDGTWIWTSCDYYPWYYALSPANEWRTAPDGVYF